MRIQILRLLVLVLSFLFVLPHTRALSESQQLEQSFVQHLEQHFQSTNEGGCDYAMYHTRSGVSFLTNATCHMYTIVARGEDVLQYEFIKDAVTTFQKMYREQGYFSVQISSEQNEENPTYQFQNKEQVCNLRIIGSDLAEKLVRLYFSCSIELPLSTFEMESIGEQLPQEERSTILQVSGQDEKNAIFLEETLGYPRHAKYVFFEKENKSKLKYLFSSPEDTFECHELRDHGISPYAFGPFGHCPAVDWKYSTLKPKREVESMVAKFFPKNGDYAMKVHESPMAWSIGNHVSMLDGYSETRTYSFFDIMKQTTEDKRREKTTKKADQLQKTLKYLFKKRGFQYDKNAIYDPMVVSHLETGWKKGDIICKSHWGLMDGDQGLLSLTISCSDTLAQQDLVEKKYSDVFKEIKAKVQDADFFSLRYERGDFAVWEFNAGFPGSGYALALKKDGVYHLISMEQDITEIMHACSSMEMNHVPKELYVSCDEGK